MTDEKTEEHNESGRWRGLLAVTLLMVAYGVSVYVVVVDNFRQRTEPGKQITLRLTHWQLEAGVRDAIEEQARAFEKAYEAETGIKVTIIQNPVNEKAYRQYVQTQCVGGTAPDLVEIGMYDEGYTRRFFLPTSEYVGKINPYNKGTDLEKTPWADTFADGMRSSLDPQTLEYYGAALNLFTIRVFYNKKMLQEATGHTTPPQKFRDFLALCARLDEWAKQRKIGGFVPVAASSYQLNFILSNYVNALSFQQLLHADINYDGALEGTETLISYLGGRHNENSPSFRLGHEATRDLTAFFPGGFMSQQRMEAGFRFTRGKAAFIVSGAWDANSYIQDADFSVGICDLPLPGTDDPLCARYFAGRQSEAAVGGATCFGVTRFSQHPEIAVRFLMFMTSQKNNELFNRRIKWIPIIRGAKSFGVMQAFTPSPEGFFGGIFLNGGTRTESLYKQLVWKYVEHSYDFKTFATNLGREMPRALAADLQLRFREAQENRVLLDATLTASSAAAVFGDTWGISPTQQQAATEAAYRRLDFLWESRASNLSSILYPLIFKQEVAGKSPLAKESFFYMTQSPFSGLE